jgi:uncharacterized membrane protein
VPYEMGRSRWVSFTFWEVSDVSRRKISITLEQTAEIIGISDRQMRRWRERYEEFGFRGHVIFFAIARKITSCTFIARSTAACV